MHTCNTCKAHWSHARVHLVHRRKVICYSMAGRTTDKAGSSARTKAEELLEDYDHKLPKCIVLDLDYTIWPFWCEMFSGHETPRLYPEVEGIIDACKQRGILLAVASRTPTPAVAMAFLQKTGLDVKFDCIQLIPAANGYDAHSAQKDKAHLPAIKAATGLQWRDMLFFDDERPNVTKVQRLGVCSVLVDEATGLCCSSLQQGLDMFAAQHS